MRQTPADRPGAAAEPEAARFECSASGTDQSNEVALGHVIVKQFTADSEVSRPKATN